MPKTRKKSKISLFAWWHSLSAALHQKEVQIIALDASLQLPPTVQTYLLGYSKFPFGVKVHAC